MSIDFNKILWMYFKSQGGVNDFIKWGKCLIRERDLFAEMMYVIKYKQED